MGKTIWINTLSVVSVNNFANQFESSKKKNLFFHAKEQQLLREDHYVKPNQNRQPENRLETLKKKLPLCCLGKTRITNL